MPFCSILFAFVVLGVVFFSAGPRVWIKVLCPTRHKIYHFGDIFPRQSLG